MTPEAPRNTYENVLFVTMKWFFMQDNGLFQKQCSDEIIQMGKNELLKKQSIDWLIEASREKYTYHFEFFDRPVIQLPQDMVAMQELIFKVKPDLIIETGIAHGGSLVMSASMLALLDMADAINADTSFDPSNSRRKVLGIDIDIRAHNRAAIEAHPMASRIAMIEGSSIDSGVISLVHQFAAKYERILICLDSNHTHDHVLAELLAYAPLTSVGSYCVVFDTVVEDMPKDLFPDRPWGPGDNPKTAVWEYIKNHPEFVIDKSIEHKLMLTVAPDGFLRRIS